MSNILIYTDGGCSGNPGKGGWGYVIVSEEDGQLCETSGSGGETTTTNNRMELTAVIEALKHIHAIFTQNTQLMKETESQAISVYTDSQYVQKGITQWIHGWKRNSWKTAAKEPVKNQDLWQQLDTLSSSLHLQWIWVKGHAGIHYNEMVDTMTQVEIDKLR